MYVYTHSYLEASWLWLLLTLQSKYNVHVYTYITFIMLFREPNHCHTVHVYMVGMHAIRAMHHTCMYVHVCTHIMYTRLCIYVYCTYVYIRTSTYTYYAHIHVHVCAHSLCKGLAHFNYKQALMLIATLKKIDKVEDYKFSEIGTLSPIFSTIQSTQNAHTCTCKRLLNCSAETMVLACIYK